MPRSPKRSDIHHHSVPLRFLQPVRHRDLKKSLSWTSNVRALRTFRGEGLIACTSSSCGPTDSRPSYVSLGPRPTSSSSHGTRPLPDEQEVSVSWPRSSSGERKDIMAEAWWLTALQSDNSSLSSSSSVGNIVSIMLTENIRNRNWLLCGVIGGYL